MDDSSPYRNTNKFNTDKETWRLQRRLLDCGQLGYEKVTTEAYRGRAGPADSNHQQVSATQRAGVGVPESTGWTDEVAHF